MKYMDVPVADVQVGDEVKVDGYGVLMTKPGFNYYAPEDDEEYRVVRLRNPRVDSVEVERIVDGIKFGEHTFAFRRSSIVSARRRTPEPSPKPGDWRHNSTNCGRGLQGRPCVDQNECCYAEVYRASGGWSRDTRTGQPWVMQNGLLRVISGDIGLSQPVGTGPTDTRRQERPNAPHCPNAPKPAEPMRGPYSHADPLGETIMKPTEPPASQESTVVVEYRLLDGKVVTSKPQSEPPIADGVGVGIANLFMGHEAETAGKVLARAYLSLKAERDALRAENAAKCPGGTAHSRDALDRLGSQRL